MSRWLADRRLQSVEDTVRADIEAFPRHTPRCSPARTPEALLELER